ncbi:efflux RND transporter periplasmic adaptor subunit [Planctomicrobium sp. SH661]|uniref:efflux RND transporter periplasmic adaptor subunit n=1 Tax=Planctomicrobium sp. SH661 TaxID=3448124 RepID=UPI003F5B8BF2
MDTPAFKRSSRLKSQTGKPTAFDKQNSPATRVSPTPEASNEQVNASGSKGEPPEAVAEVKTTAPSSSKRWQKRLVGGISCVAVVVAVVWNWPMLVRAWNTVSTDDAYVNGHVTFVAPRVSGQIVKVYVDDNNRVKKGDLLAQIDPVPYRIKVETQKAAVAVAKADLVEADARVRALVAQIRANRFSLEYTMEQVNDRIAKLQSSVATLNSRIAQRELAKQNFRRAEDLTPLGAMTKESFDTRLQTLHVDDAQVEEALQEVYANRVSLGLSRVPEEGHELAEVPTNLDQNFSSVREALAVLIQSAAEIGYVPASYDQSPAQAIADFAKQDRDGNLERIWKQMIATAPQIKQAQSRLEQAQRNLEQAELDLFYCDIVSEIDGVVTRRNVNPGNNVQAGQSLLAVRSLTEIWIDANFKETQLSRLRIGQRVVCDVDMYGRKQEFEGRITGFTMGTGQSLSLLPPQNATGNFVKIVQRLPVRIELTNYNPDEIPLFVGLSVEPHVYFKEPATGPHAGAFLQETMTLPQHASNPTPSPSDMATETQEPTANTQSTRS